MMAVNFPDLPKPKDRRDIEEFCARSFLDALPDSFDKGAYVRIAEAVGKAVAATLKEFVDPRAIWDEERT